jgi:hypothetical protein
MRAQLLDLGFDVPAKDYAYRPPNEQAQDALRDRADANNSNDSNVTLGELELYAAC